jgi:3-oxoacyl-[acyl-carrier protein] reductase
VHTGSVHTGSVHTGSVHTGSVHTGSVHTGSDSVTGMPRGSTAYVTAEAGQLAMARMWAAELGRFGVTVAPGWIPLERHGGVPAADVEGYAAGVPLGRMGVPEDVAGAVAHLVSDEAAFVTGAYLAVNGGSTIG